MTKEGLSEEEQNQILTFAADYAGDDELLTLEEAKEAIEAWMDEMDEESDWSEWDTEEWEAEVKDQIAAIAGDDAMISEDELREALEDEDVSDWEIDAIVAHAAEYADDDGKVDLDSAWDAF